MKYDIEGSKYLAKTKHVCAVCNSAADGTMLWLKSKIPNGNAMLECPRCQTITPISYGQLVIDPKFPE